LTAQVYVVCNTIRVLMAAYLTAGSMNKQDCCAGGNKKK